MEVVGINEDNVKKISSIKKEDNWIRDYRVDSYHKFESIGLPEFGPKIDLDFSKIIYYKNNEQDEKIQSDWNNILKPIVDDLDSVGVREAETHMGGMGVQYESEVIYHSMIQEIEDKKVIFTSIENSGGSFIYVPKNTKLDRPLQSYFRINSRNMGQFERTLIIVDDNSDLHYIEGCTAPSYSESSLHAAVVEIYVGKNSKCRYSTVQNWANNVYNLVTKRAEVDENGTMEWIDGNIGSLVTMKYPCCVLKGDYSKGTCITISVAGEGQIQDTGARMIHIGKHTKSNIISKSIARNGGNATYRGKAFINTSAKNSEASVKCDTLILDSLSKSDTIPVNSCFNLSSNIEHEATVSKISEDNLFYMMSRGISRERAMDLIILGFIEKFREELPMEYAVELNQLIKRNL